MNITLTKEEKKILLDALDLYQHHIGIQKLIYDDYFSNKDHIASNLWSLIYKVETKD